MITTGQRYNNSVMQEETIYVQKPAEKSQLLALLNNVPASVLQADVKAVLCLDELKRVANNLKTTP